MHYYTANGESKHEIVGKNGRKRPTTIRDARKLGLVPSVTTIMDVQAKPALISWLQNQLLEAAIKFPFNANEDDEGYWKKTIVRLSKEVGETAAKRGNSIHDSMETYFKTGSMDHNRKFTEQSIRYIHEIFPSYNWIAEASFAHKEGFGGRVDLYGYDVDGNNVIIDFKTKDKSEIESMVQYDDHKIQLAAYQEGLQLPSNTRRFNLFISVHEDTPGLFSLIECMQFDKFRNLFYALLNLWQIKNNYTPEISNERF